MLSEEIADRGISFFALSDSYGKELLGVASFFETLKDRGGQFSKFFPSLQRKLSIILLSIHVLEKILTKTKDGD